MTSPRRDRRINVAMRVEILDRNTGEELFTKNVSVGGLFLITTHRYPIGGVLPLRLDYKGLLVEVSARVTHIQRDGIGVRFWNAGSAVEEAVSRIIDDLLASGHHGNDRRRESRIWVQDTPVVWRRGELDHPAELADLSLSGARLRATETPDVDEKVLLMLPTPSSEAGSDRVDLVGSDACVRRVIDDQFGVEFDGPSAEFRLAVAKLLSLSGRELK
ncbi:MAG: PilZ domain-containing protein [Myxococcota bacterium]